MKDCHYKIYLKSINNWTTTGIQLYTKYDMVTL
jgi:hypothetical protein